MLEWFFKYVLGEMRAVMAAPLSFAIASLSLAVIAFLVSQWANASIIAQKEAAIATLQERLKLRDDQLANKIQTTPPDEARALIAGLEARLKELAPRTIDAQNQQSAIASLKASQPSEIFISYDVSCTDCSKLAAQLTSIFSQAKWIVQNSSVMGPSTIPPTGVAIFVQRPDSLSPVEKAAVGALEAAHIKFDVLPPARSSFRVPWILVTAPNT